MSIQYLLRRVGLSQLRISTLDVKLLVMFYVCYGVCIGRAVMCYVQYITGLIKEVNRDIGILNNMSWLCPLLNNCLESKLKWLISQNPNHQSENLQRKYHFTACSETNVGV